MLDSLVRVSRRVGWSTDRFATDPKAVPVTQPESRHAVGQHCRSSQGRSIASGEPGTVEAAADPRSTDERTAESLNTCGRSAQVTFLPGFSPPANRSWRSTRRKCTPRRRPLAARRVLTDPRRTARRLRRELNSPGRLCGSTRLPLSGFTYS